MPTWGIYLTVWYNVFLLFSAEFDAENTSSVYSMEEAAASIPSTECVERC